MDDVQFPLHHQGARAHNLVPRRPLRVDHDNQEIGVIPRSHVIISLCPIVTRDIAHGCQDAQDIQKPLAVVGLLQRANGVARRQVGLYGSGDERVCEEGGRFVVRRSHCEGDLWRKRRVCQSKRRKKGGDVNISGEEAGWGHGQLAMRDAKTRRQRG